MTPLLFLLLTVGTVSADICEVNYRILGGVNADKDEFPGLVYLDMEFVNWSGESGFYCGGSLISDRWVLTAAHCFVNPPMEFEYVQVRPTKGHPNYIETNNVILHEEFDDSNLFNDIALIRLPVSWSTINPSFKATPLPLQDQPLTTNEVTMVGWGVISDTINDLHSPYLQKLEHFPINQGLCMLYGLDEMNRLCYLPKLETGSSCSGDSGGPIFMDGLQVGIVSGSWKYKIGNTMQRIGVDTRVSAYINWIEGKKKLYMS